MKELTAGQAYEFGSDQTWPVVKANGRFKSFTPNSSFSIRHLEYDNKANIDEFGGRHTKYNEGGEMVPFLGDSFTFGVGVEDEETYVSLLSEIYGVRFLNLGVPGSALHSQKDIIEMRHHEIGKPNIYVFNVFIGNDFDDIYGHDILESNKNVTYKKKKAVPWIASINGFVYHNNILKRSYTIQFFRQKVLQSITRDSEVLINPIFKITRKDKPYLIIANKSFNKELERLIAMSSTFRFGIIFIILPDVYQVNKDLMRVKAKYYGIEEDMLDMLAPNRILEKNFRDHQIHFIDTTDCLMRNDRVDMLYYTQDNHFTKYGHKSVAECIEEQGFHSIVNSLSRR